MTELKRGEANKMTEYINKDQLLAHLFSKQALKDGYGHTCKMKARREEREREAAKDQYSLFEDGHEDRAN